MGQRYEPTDPFLFLETNDSSFENFEAEFAREILHAFDYRSSFGPALEIEY
jgi:hypothetical protein